MTTRGYLTTVSWNQLTDKPNLAGTYTFNVAADDSTLRTISSDETVKFIGAGGITTASDAEGNITITGPSLAGLATETYVTTQGYITSSALTGLATETFVTTKGYLTAVDYNIITNTPAPYTWSIAADDSTQRQVNSDNLIKFVGGTGITTSSDTDGNITIDGFSGSYNDLSDKPISTALNANGTLSMPPLSSEPAGKAAGQIALADGNSWDPLAKGLNQPYLTIYTGTSWIEIGGITMDQVYTAILEMT